MYICIHLYIYIYIYIYICYTSSNNHVQPVHTYDMYACNTCSVVAKYIY